MDLKLLTWNINFINNSWLKRVKCINTLLDKKEDYHIIALQEVTIPVDENMSKIYGFINNMKYKTDTFLTRNVIYKNLANYFPQNKINIITAFKYLMDKLFIFISYFMSNFGNTLIDIYVNYGILGKIFGGFLTFAFPLIFISMWFFIGMMTLINKSLKPIINNQTIGDGRIIQYSEFKFNTRDVLFINIHLSYKNNDEKVKENEITELLEFVKKKEKDIVILAGDFNSNSSSIVYKTLIENNYKSVMLEKHGKELNTFPSNKPTKCLDYIWIKGEKINVKNANVLGNEKYTDHLGIETTITVNK
jgi:endonuclease/exonuclease/phosphatase family metal-dependent hydrolase